MKLVILAVAAATASQLPAHNWTTPPRKATADALSINYYDGNKLLEVCRSDDYQCATYVVGVTDGQLAAIVATSRTRAYCIPKGATSEQVKDVVVKYLIDHPQERHLLGGILVAEALSQAWPQC